MRRWSSCFVAAFLFASACTDSSGVAPGLEPTNGVGADSVPTIVHFPGLGLGDVGVRLGSGTSAISTILKGQASATLNADGTSSISIVATSRQSGPATADTLRSDTLLIIKFTAKLT